jgi:L-fuculose-phosphate aldolase
VARASSSARRAIIDACVVMNRAGLNQGKAGNVSIRSGRGCLITPSGVDYEAMTPGNIVHIDLAGNVLSGAAGLEPSSEWRMHADIYARFGEAGAVVHAHPPYATALACNHRGIPAFHYMVAVAGGDDIRCADYATFGTPELSRNMLVALEGRSACLLANHGMICFGGDLDAAFARAVEVEALARQYVLALGIGKPVILGEAEMNEVLERFKHYGQPTRR